jgi:hypothetical protein
VLLQEEENREGSNTLHSGLVSCFSSHTPHAGNARDIPWAVLTQYSNEWSNKLCFGLCLFVLNSYCTPTFRHGHWTVTRINASQYVRGLSGVENRLLLGQGVNFPGAHWIQHRTGPALQQSLNWFQYLVVQVGFLLHWCYWVILLFQNPGRVNATDQESVQGIWTCSALQLQVCERTKSGAAIEKSKTVDVQVSYCRPSTIFCHGLVNSCHCGLHGSIMV